MQFIETERAAATSYFECRRGFAPSGGVIDLRIDGQLSGPTQQQKKFFRWVEDAYWLLVPQWISLLNEEFGPWMPRFQVVDFTQEFTPSYLAIPTCETQPVAWEIMCDTVHNLNHIVTIGMRGAEVSYRRVDG